MKKIKFKLIKNDNKNVFSMIFHETVMDIILKISVLVILIIMFITGYLYVQIIFYLLGLYY
ncbi:hypothetical protein, partial [Peribacillus butanolivorans]